MDNDKRIDDIIAMLDGFASNEGGRMNITVSQDSDVTSKNIKMANSSDCAEGNVACKTPTLFEGVDDNKR